MKPLTDAKVAIVFEWFQRFGGGEKVVLEILNLFPNADLFALVHDAESLKGSPLENKTVTTSFIQKLPFSKKHYRAYLPLMPIAVEQLDLRAYDVVISSTHTVAKGVLTKADQLHIAYMHTPVRYAWDLYLDYLHESRLDRGPASVLARAILHYLRIWDVSAANRVDFYITNSNYVARRIKKLYRRSAEVIYPPVNVSRYEVGRTREDFYVTVSRFVPYKRIDLIVEAFSRMNRPLVVVGDGPDREKITHLSGSNVTLMGHQPDDVVQDLLKRARAFVFAADEDFGIVPVEAQASGCPVIAYGKGGALETVIGWPDPEATGMFFDAQTPEAIIEAVTSFEDEPGRFSADACRRNAERFSQERFRAELWDTVAGRWQSFQGESGKVGPG